MKPTLLIVDDDEEIRSQLRWALTAEYDVVQAGDRAEALAKFREHRPAVVLLDLGLPPSPASPVEGLSTLSEIITEERLAKVVIVSGQGERANAMQAIGQGAWDFVGKPVDMAELQAILRRAFHVAQLERDFQAMQREFQEDAFEGILGKSPGMQEVFRLIQRVASTDASVLILGESGTGKEMVAQAIHSRSRRAKGPFVAINCGAIPENLIESELFGHEKGAFTGAVSQRPGRIETAQDGTLFLDEIGELPAPLQVRLLRFLQEQRIERVGGRESIRVDVRVLAATHVDLKQAMATARFREDLFYRLAVVTLRLPALRERSSDIALLSQAFLRRFAAHFERNNLTFDAAALRAIERHPWPGNVRELENRIKRAVIMADGRQVTTRDLELESTEAPSATTLKEAREQLERELVVQALRRNGGKITGAANELGISRPTLYELMDKLGIQREN
ncbi:MAG: PEP-CTERM-box response regulator transcription factor [Verrucomicrobiales bacterium]|nr:PEP-CTERM-box response regulator transcription factor [Verrucomicrobiales bacterium]